MQTWPPHARRGPGRAVLVRAGLVRAGQTRLGRSGARRYRAEQGGPGAGRGLGGAVCPGHDLSLLISKTEGNRPGRILAYKIAAVHSNLSNPKPGHLTGAEGRCSARHGETGTRPGGAGRGGGWPERCAQSMNSRFSISRTESGRPECFLRSTDMCNPM